MPLTLKDLDDPIFRSLPEEEQYKGRVEVFRDLTKNDPMFAGLPLAERRKLLFPEKASIITQEEFEKSRNLPPGFSGGVERLPFLQEPATQAVLMGLGAPLGAGPSVLYGGRGATLIEQALRGAGTFGTAGVVQGVEQGTGALKTGLKEALFGGLFGPAVAPAKTMLGGIARPLGLGAAVGAVTAEPGERLQGALMGAAGFGAFKGVARGVGLLGEGLSKASRNLFRQRPGSVSIADAPAGLTEEVFGSVPPLQRPVKSRSIDPSAPDLPLFNKVPEPSSTIVKPRPISIPSEPLPPPPILSDEAKLIKNLQSRFGPGAPPPNVDELGMLKSLTGTDDAVASTAAEVIARYKPGIKPPPPPPIIEPKTITELSKALPKARGFEAEQGNIWSEIRQITGKGGMRFSTDLGSDRAALLKDNPVAKQIVRSAKNKNAMAADEVATELFNRGLIDDPTEASLLVVLRGAKGPGARGSIPSVKQESLDVAISGIEQETQRGNLIALMDRYEPDHPIFIAASRRLKAIDPAVQMADITLDMIDDGAVKDVLAGNFGLGPYTSQQLENAQKIANKIQQKGVLNVTFQQTPAGKQGIIPGAESRQVPKTGLVPRGKQQESLLPLEQAAMGEKQLGLQPRTPNAKEFLNKPVDPISLKQYTEADLNDLAAQAYKLKKTDHVRAIEKEFAERMQGIRPPNDNPLDDLGRAEKDNLIEKILKDEKGAVWMGQDPKSNSIEQDMNGFFDRWQDQFTSWKDHEFRRAANAFVKRAMPAQVLARQHSEFKPIWEGFHAYPRKAVTRHFQVVQKLFKESGGTYFELSDLKRKAVDKMLLMHKVNRPDLPRYTPAELAARGFDQDQIKAFNDVLDYGRSILNAHREWFIESRLPAMVQAGKPELVARAELEAKAQIALQGMEHWVPHYRVGDKTVTVRDAMGKVLEFRLVPSVRERVAAVAELKQKFPGARIEEGLLENFVKTKAFDEIDLASLEVLSRFAKVDPTISREFIDQIRPTIIQRSDALSRFKHFENIPGFKEDLREGLIQAGNSAFHYIERQKAYRQAVDAVAKINANEKPELFKFATQFVEDNIKPGEKRFQAVRDGAYAWLLGGNMKQFAVQLTQLPTVVYPRLLRFGTVNEANSAMNTGMRWALGRGDALKKGPLEYQKFWEEFHRAGAVQPRAEMYVGDMLERIPWIGEMAGLKMPGVQAQIEERMAQELMKFKSPGIRVMKNIRDIWMLPLTDADMRSRLAAGTAFYKMGRETLRMNPAEATQFAINEANRTNYLYGRAENPQLFGRGPIAQFANMLKTWPANYFGFISEVYRDAAKEAAAMGVPLYKTPDFRTLAASAGAMLALGGVLHNVPGVVKSALNAGFGFDIETETRRLLSGELELPDAIVEATLRGVGALAGVDISRSIAIGDVVPQSITEIFGPVPSITSGIWSGLGQLAQNQTQTFGPTKLDALEILAGGGIKNFLKAYRLITEQGITTRRGGQMAGTEELRDIDPYLQVLGFTPLAVANAKAIQQTLEKSKQAHRTQQSRVYEDLGRAILKEDEKAITSIMTKIEQHNEKATAENRVDQVITIDRNRLRQQIAEMVTPKAAIKRTPKNMRGRQQELEQLYLPPRLPTE